VSPAPKTRLRASEQSHLVAQPLILPESVAAARGRVALRFIAASTVIAIGLAGRNGEPQRDARTVSTNSFLTAVADSSAQTITAL